MQKTEFTKAVEKFVDAAADLDKAWEGMSTEPEVEAATKAYPSYLPSFDEFTSDLIDMRDAVWEVSPHGPPDKVKDFAIKLRDLIAEANADGQEDDGLYQVVGQLILNTASMQMMYILSEESEGVLTTALRTLNEIIEAVE